MRQDLETPRALVVLATTLWVVLALWLYTPFSPRPYDVVDFFDFLPVLRGSSSFIEAFTGLTSLYAAQGRFNVVGLALLGFKWELFGENMIGWQLFRFAEMCLVCLLLYWVLRELRASRLGAFLATLVFLASPPAAVNWMKLTAAEPVGTLLVLVVMLLLLRSTDASATVPVLIGLAVVTLCIGLVKELLLAAVVVPALVIRQLTSAPDARGVRAVIRSSRLLAIAIGACIAAVPVLVVAVNAARGAYVSGYGLHSIDAGTAFMPLVATFLPFAPDDGIVAPLLLAAVALFVLVIVGGWGLLLAPRQRTRERGLLLALGILLPVSGAIMYAPWPAYALMYALPFQIGTAVLLSHAVMACTASRTARGALSIALALPAALMVTHAQQYSRFIDRSLHMSRDLATYLGTLHTDRPIRLEVCPGLRPSRWAGYGRILVRYAASLGAPAPDVQEDQCSPPAVSQPFAQASTPRIVLSDARSPDATATGSRTYSYRIMDWAAMRTRHRALVVTTFALKAP
jgi:hypothetical protein